MPPFSKDTEEASTTAPRQPHGRRGPSTQVPEPLRAAPAQSPQAAWGQAGCSLQTTLLRGKTPAVVRSGPPHRDAAPDPKSSFSPPYKRVRGEGRGGGGGRHKPGAVLAAEKLEKEEETGLQVLPSLPPPRSVAFPCLVHRELRGSRSSGRLGGGSPARGSRAAPARQSTVPPSPALAGLGDAHDSRGYGDRAAARPSPGTPPPLGSLIQPMPPRYRTAPGRRTRSSPAAEAVAHGAVGG